MALFDRHCVVYSNALPSTVSAHFALSCLARSTRHLTLRSNELLGPLHFWNSDSPFPKRPTQNKNECWPITSPAQNKEGRECSASGAQMSKSLSEKKVYSLQIPSSAAEEEGVGGALGRHMLPRWCCGKNDKAQGSWGISFSLLFLHLPCASFQFTEEHMSTDHILKFQEYLK